MAKFRFLALQEIAHRKPVEYGERPRCSVVFGENVFSMDKMPSEKLARLLDEEYGICTRAGFHCSALGHKTLGTPADGAVRISFGCFNHMSDVEALTLALSELSRRVN